jgi:hypothetical protein
MRQGTPGHAGRVAVLLGLTWLLGALGAVVGVTAAATVRPAAPSAQGSPAGRIVMPRGQTIVSVDAATGEQRALFTVPPTELILDVGLAAGGREVVFSGLTLARRDDPGGADIYRLPADGGEPVRLAAHARPGDILAAPLAVPGSASVVYTYTPYGLGDAAGEPLPRVERVALDGGAPSVVVQEAEWPAPTPDGARLAFVRRGARGDALWLANLDGSEAHELIPPDRFLSLAYPRVSPDGRRVVVAATVELPSLPLPTLPGGLGPTVGPAPGRGPRLASAGQLRRPGGHGLPWDLWSVALDGSDLQRLTQWYEDDPSLAWSPDGRWLAVLGGSGLRVLAVASGDSSWLRREPAFGAIDWGAE